MPQSTGPDADAGSDLLRHHRKSLSELRADDPRTEVGDPCPDRRFLSGVAGLSDGPDKSQVNTLHD